MGIEGTDAALGLNRKDGQLYITRTLLANNDPRYLARIQQILNDGKVSRIGGIGTDKKLIDKLIDFINRLEGKVEKIDVYTSVESSKEYAEYARDGIDYDYCPVDFDCILKTKSHGNFGFQYKID